MPSVSFTVGRVLTANQNPFPADYPYRVGGNFSAPYRARQIRADRRGAEVDGGGDDGGAGGCLLVATIWRGTWWRPGSGSRSKPQLAAAVEILAGLERADDAEAGRAAGDDLRLWRLRRMIAEKAAGQPGGGVQPGHR
jgi:hypothetical protein